MTQQDITIKTKNEFVFYNLFCAMSQLSLRVGVDERVVTGVDWGDNLLFFNLVFVLFSISLL